MGVVLTRAGLGLLLFALLTASALVPRSNASTAEVWGTLALNVRDPKGRPLAARARIVPRSLRERMRLLRFDDAAAVVEGRAELPLPAGVGCGASPA